MPNNPAVMTKSNLKTVDVVNPIPIAEIPIAEITAGNTAPNVNIKRGNFPLFSPG